MSRPSQKDFNDAVRNPSSAFTDPDLAAADPVLGSNGRPQPHTGNASDVYQLCSPDDRIWAVKCFTKPGSLAHRYARIQEAITPSAFPFAVGCTYLEDGIRVNGVRHPVLKMEWVEGLPLNQVARERSNSPAVMDSLFTRFVQLCRELQWAGIAHGDLQHANVLLVPGAWPGAYTLKLVDYDAMYLPSLGDAPSGEVGHANYQHPARASEQTYSPDLDRFPLLVIATALKALSVFGPRLWERYDTKDNLLFTAADFQTPAASPLMRELWQADHPALRKLVGKLALACGRPIAQTPWLDDLAAELDTPLTVEETAAVNELLGSPNAAPVTPANVTPLAEAFTLDDEPRAAPPKPPAQQVRPQPLAAVVVHDLDDEPEEEAPRPRPKKRRRKEEEPARKFPVIPVAILAGLLLLGGGVGAGLLIADQLKPKETAQHQEPPPAPPPVTPTPAPAPAPKPPESKPPAPKPEPPLPPPAVLGPPGFQPVWTRPVGDGRVGVKPFFAADGKTVFVATGAKVEVLDARNGNPRSELRNPGLPLNVMSVWSLGRDRVAVAGFPLRVPGVWDAKTGEPLDPLFAQDSLPPAPPGVTNTAIECRLSPDGRFLFAGYQGQFRQPTYGAAPYRVTEVATGKAVAQGDWTFGTVRFTADGSKMLMAETSGRVKWIKLPSGETEIEWAYQPNAFPRMINGLSGDGSLFVYFGKPPGLPFDPYLVDGKTGQVLRKLGGGLGSERSTLTADGKWIVGVANDPTDLRRLALLVTDARTGEVLVRTPYDGGLNDVSHTSLTPDGKGIVLHNRRTREIAVYELRGAAPPVAQAVPPAPLGPVPERVKPGTSVVVAPELPPPPVPAPGGFPAAPAMLKARWSIATEAGIMSNGLPQPPLYSKDGGTIVLSGGNTGTILTFDARTGAAGAAYDGHKGPGGVYWLALAGDRVVSGGFDGKQATWDMKSGKRVDDVKFPELPPMPDGARGHAGMTYAVSPGGRYTVQARKESVRPVVPGPLRVLDTTTGKEVLKADWNGGRIVFTADESRVFILNGLGKASWYKLPSGEPESEWATGVGVQAEMARVLGMTADGSKLLYHGPLANRPVGAYLLDGKTGQVQRKLGGAPYQAAWSTLAPDGKHAAVSVIDFATRTWYLDVFEVDNWRLVGRIAPPARAQQGPQQFSFSPDGKEIGVFYPQAKELSVYPVP